MTSPMMLSSRVLVVRATSPEGARIAAENLARRERRPRMGEQYAYGTPEQAAGADGKSWRVGVQLWTSPEYGAGDTQVSEGGRGVPVSATPAEAIDAWDDE